MVTPAAPSIFTSGTQQLTAVGYDQSGNQMSGLTFVWASSNQSVATVGANGLASGVSVGTSQISASAQGIHSNDDHPDRQPAAFGFDFDPGVSVHCFDSGGKHAAVCRRRI